METKVYVDVLLVINYIINMLLVLCTAKLTGRRPKRRRIVAAALFGAGGSLTIFLPFFGFGISVLAKLFFSSMIVLIAFSFIDAKVFGKQLFVFFAVSFFFAGAMLAVWTAFSPKGMLYYNGVVYFDLSSVTLIGATAVAYALLSLAHRFSRRGRVAADVYEAEIRFRGKSVVVSALADTGNSLTEPFSNIPVMVCRVADMSPLLPRGAAECILSGGYMTGEFASRYDIPLRLVPYRGVGGDGAVPAFRPDLLLLAGKGETLRVENVYVGIATGPLGGDGYRAILNPDLVGMRILQGGVTK